MGGWVGVGGDLEEEVCVIYVCMCVLYMYVCTYVCTHIHYIHVYVIYIDIYLHTLGGSDSKEEGSM